MRFQGQKLGYVAGSQADGKSVILRLPHSDLSAAPRLGDLVLISDTATIQKWLARVEKSLHVSIELHEQEVRNAIARGQTSLGSELSDHEKEMYLGNDYELKLLGEIRDGFEFRPVVRILPPRGSLVNHLKADQLKQLVTLDEDGAVIGYYAVGDEVYNTNSNQIPVKFSIKRFVSRRSAIFGVAGFGKSNLMKNLIAFLTVSEHNVGKLIFDLDGEYAFGTDGKGKKSKGLADIPAVAERLVVYTNAGRKEENYIKIIDGAPVLNLGEISARKVISTLLPDSRQDRVYADLLKALTKEKWQRVLDLVTRNGFDTNTVDVANIFGISHDDNLASIQGMIRALVPITSRGHSSASNMLSDVLENLKLGATVIIDLSSMGLDAAYNLTTFMIDELFETNQTTFVAGGKVPEVVVFVEEAQNLLSEKQVKDGNPLARLAKEGRKYNLGLIYVSQQPGAIAKEILTQTNTYFVLHLLSKIDLKALQEINPHYEGVNADFIQMESLQGHAYIYSTVPDMSTQSYVFSTKAANFDETAESLSKLPLKGNKALKHIRQETVEKLAAFLDKILSSQNCLGETEFGSKYKSAPISGALAQRLSDEFWYVKSNKNPQYMNDTWLERACEYLGFTVKTEWEDRVPYLYLKNKDEVPPDVKRTTAKPDEEIPF